MRQEDLWLLFRETGIPELYLAYRHYDTIHGRDQE